MDAACHSLLAQLCRLCACPTAYEGVPNRHVSAEELLFQLWIAHENHTLCDTCRCCILDLSVKKSEKLEPEDQSFFSDEVANCNSNEENSNCQNDKKLMQLKETSSASNQEQKSGHLVDYSSSEDDSMDSYQKLVIDDDFSVSAKTAPDVDHRLQKQNPSKKCIYCLKCYPSYHNLWQHIKIVHRGDFIKCEFSKRCPTYFKTQEEREKHYQNDHVSGKKLKVWCPFCNQKYCKKSIHTHLEIRHFQEQPIRCSYVRCASYFKTGEEQQHHVKSVHENFDEKFRCLYCGKFHLRLLHEHVRSQHPDVAIRCNFGKRCYTYFKTEEERQQHNRKVHLRTQEITKKPAVGQFCVENQSSSHQMDEVFKGDGEEKAAQQKIKIRFFVCPSCPKAFLDKQKLQKHKKLVHRNRVCQLCRKWFIRKGQSGFCRECEKYIIKR